MRRRIGPVGSMLGCLILLFAWGCGEDDGTDTSAISEAQAVAACKAGKLADFVKVECAVGDLEFKFLDVEKSEAAKGINVKPVANGLEFELALEKGQIAKVEIADFSAPTQLATSELITIQTGFSYEVKGKTKPIISAELAGKTVALPAGATVSATMALGSKTEEEVKLDSEGFRSTKATFTTPVKAGATITVRHNFEVHSGKSGQGFPAAAKLPFTATFTSGK